ncbi:MAG TPA: hypothetical protein VIZ18_19990 [Ktedonobacteraceae bacterium]
MRKLLSSKTGLSVLVLFTLVAAFMGGAMLHNASTAKAATPKTSSTQNGICSRLGKSIEASAGALAYCFGSQKSGGSQIKTTSGSFVPNVDAANLNEDITPNGTRGYGQSETSIAGIGSYVVEGWNDSTGFFAPCPSPMFKEELTGYGFSANGGKSFTDEGGLPNDCTTGFKYEGDPSVEAYQPGGAGHPAYFYISSLYVNGTTGMSDIAMDACTATGSGSSASITCSGPVIIASGGPGDFLDKDFLSIDPARARLYASYTRFGSAAATVNGQIELAVCDLSTPATPTCYPGASTTPYLIVQPGQACENEGAYPAVDVHSGDVYVAWEYNWATNYLGPAPCNTTEHVQNRVAYAPFACLTLTPVSPCATAPNQVSVNIVSIDTAFIPGFNRVPAAGNSPANDFPRIAVSDSFGTVSIVWNDTRYHPMGDILLQSYHLVSLSPIQSSPARVNPDFTGGLHFMPAIRNTDDGGHLSVSYFQRNSPNTSLTNVDAVLDLNPTATGPAGTFVVVTTKPSDWLNVSSDIIPNFGDYTDNYFLAKSQAPYTDDVLYVAWSDGRLGVPQPFEAHGMS